jgi:flagella basal body P-ring formation protein FlgA
VMRRWAAAVATLLALSLPAPADAQAPAESVALAARDLPRGITLEASDFVMPAGSTVEAVGPLGWVTKRIVKQGDPLRAPAVAPAEVIRSGDTVQLVWSDGAIQMRITGKAMNSAAVGEPVNVRVDTKRRFEGTALATGEVRLDSPESSRSR